MAEVMTVLGPIDSDDLGLTSMHEHIVYDGRVYRQRVVNILPPEEQLPVKADDKVTLENIYYHKRDFLLSWDGVSMHDEDVMREEVADFKASGGSAMIDVSVPGLRSDLPAIRRIAQATGVHIIATTGLYAEDSWPERFKAMSTQEYVDYMRGEIEQGIEDTGIKAGHIKAAIEGAPSPQEIKLLEAVAQMSTESGLAVSIHHHPTMGGDELRKIMTTLENAGADPARILMCHMQNSLTCWDVKTLVQDPSARGVNLDLNKEVMDRGFIAGHDCFGHDYRVEMAGQTPSAEWQNLAAIYELCKAGYAKQITLATDTYLKILTRRFGGGGYSHLTTSVLPMLERVGVPSGDIQQMSVLNPARILSRV